MIAALSLAFALASDTHGEAILVLHLGNRSVDERLLREHLELVVLGEQAHEDLHLQKGQAPPGASVRRRAPEVDEVLPRMLLRPPLGVELVRGPGEAGLRVVHAHRDGHAGRHRAVLSEVDPVVGAPVEGRRGRLQAHGLSDKLQRRPGVLNALLEARAVLGDALGPLRPPRELRHGHGEHCGGRDLPRKSHGHHGVVDLLCRQCLPVLGRLRQLRQHVLPWPLHWRLLGARELHELVDDLASLGLGLHGLAEGAEAAEELLHWDGEEALHDGLYLLPQSAEVGQVGICEGSQQGGGGHVLRQAVHLGQQLRAAVPRRLLCHLLQHQAAHPLDLRDHERQLSAGEGGGDLLPHLHVQLVALAAGQREH
mmetsp:Transcript_22772/g.46106  ORF Transcript_22772/g.46106 Transcript_22772/m.46106 type:complete len:368 (-) Transcript_22772:540-1643(-)